MYFGNVALNGADLPQYLRGLQSAMFQKRLLDSCQADTNELSCISMPMEDITLSRVARFLVLVVMAALLSACGGSGFLKGKGSDGDGYDARDPRDIANNDRGKIWDIFNNNDDPNVTIGVNKYIWNATLDVLSFLPVEAADPFSGVIVMGWGRPKGSNRSYRATVYIQDPALDARSLRVALVTKSGPANRDTIRAIEDAILTRARQIRIADGKL